MIKRRTLAVLLLTCLLLGVSTLAQAVTITYMTPETDPSAVRVDNLIIERFEEANPGVKVELTHTNLDTLMPKLSAMLRAGTGPDVAFSGPRYVPILADQGFIVPVEDAYNEIGDIPLEFATPVKDGQIYDVPIAMESRVLYYRKDWFEEEGIKPPTTWSEWLEAAAKLTKDTDGDGKVDRYGVTIRGGAPENYVAFSALLWTNDARYFDENNNVVIDSPEAIEALDFWGKLAEYAPPGVSNTQYADMAVQFANGLVGMVHYPGRLLLNIDRYNPDLTPEQVGVVVPPKGPNAEKTAVRAAFNNLIVFKGDNEDLAKEFVKFYVADKQYLEFCSAVPGHVLPTRQSFLEMPEFYEIDGVDKWEPLVKKSLGLAFEYGTDFHYEPKVINPYMAEAVNDPNLSRQISKFLNGDITAEEALSDVAEEWRDRFGIN